MGEVEAEVDLVIEVDSVIEEEEAVVEAVPEVALAVEEEHQEEELEVGVEVAEVEGVELLVPRADSKCIIDILWYQLTNEFCRRVIIVRSKI